MNLNYHKPSFIYITGCDGTGKSTQAKLLIEQMKALGIKARRLWLRFPFFFSIPLLVYARWRGYSWTEKNEGIVYGYWNFHPSWLMRTIFPWVLLADAALASVWKIYLPMKLGWTIICERFSFDILVDLAVGLEDPSIFKRIPGTLFEKLIPHGANIVALDLPEELIRGRRNDLRNDRKLSCRLMAFKNICSVYHIKVLSSQEDVQTVNKAIREMIFYAE